MVGAVAAPHRFQRAGDLAHRGARAHRADRQVEQVALPAARRLGERRERRGHADGVARLAHLREALDLRTRAPRCCRSRAPPSASSCSGFHLFTPTITSCAASMRACFSAADASILSLAQPDSTARVMPPIASTSSRIDHALSAMSCVSRSMMYEPPHGSITLVMCVSSCSITCVLRAMRAAKSDGSATASSNELVCSDCVPPNTAAIASIVGAHDVVVRVLLGQRPARRLAVRAQHRATSGSRGANAVHDPPPQKARRAQLGDLQVEVHADAEEERQPSRELVDVHAARERQAHVLAAVGERERELERLVARPLPACGSRRSRSS